METSNSQPLWPVPASEPALLWMKGVANGKAGCILDTLSDYGKVPLGVQERILHQTSFFQLDRWFLLARQIRSLEFFYKCI